MSYVPFRERDEFEDEVRVASSRIKLDILCLKGLWREL
jgi:hypothetical protein